MHVWLEQLSFSVMYSGHVLRSSEKKRAIRERVKVVAGVLVIG